MLAFQRILFGALVAVQRPVLSFTSFVQATNAAFPMGLY